MAGNVAFKAGRLEEAVALYDRALDVLRKGDAPGVGGGGVSDAERRIIQGKLARDTMQNKAMCLLKLKRHQEAVDTCTQVLEQVLGKESKIVPCMPMMPPPSCLHHR